MKTKSLSDISLSFLGGLVKRPSVIKRNFQLFLKFDNKDKLFKKVTRFITCQMKQNAMRSGAFFHLVTIKIVKFFFQY